MCSKHINKAEFCRKQSVQTGACSCEIQFELPSICMACWANSVSSGATGVDCTYVSAVARFYTWACNKINKTYT